MILDRGQELPMVQINMGGGYNRNATKWILAEAEREHGADAVGLNLEQIFEFNPGMRFARK